MIAWGEGRWGRCNLFKCIPKNIRFGWLATTNASCFISCSISDYISSPWMEIPVSERYRLQKTQLQSQVKFSLVSTYSWTGL